MCLRGREFNGQGNCVSIFYLPQKQKLPRAQACSYPVQEKYNLICIFSSEPDLATTNQPPEILKFNQPGRFTVPIATRFPAHFFICNENTMNLFHGFLHPKLQGWFDLMLSSLHEAETSVVADYQVFYQYWMAKFLGLSDRADAVTTLPVSVQYHYPHYYTTSQEVSALYLFCLPVSPTQSLSFAFFFFKVCLT